MKTILIAVLGLMVLPGLCLAGQQRGHLETDELPAYLRDRGEGVSSSMFATYIQKGQLLIYPFFEYYQDADYEYKPSELGYTGDADYRGEYEASEELIFIGYGFSDHVALEIEAAVIQAELKKGDEDHSDFPETIEKSGLGDVESQLRVRWSKETESRPEFFSYLETVFPTQDEGSLIGTTDWEIKLGSGVMRGFSIGTITARVAVEYDAAESVVEVGELALEYMRRLSAAWRIYGGVEGTQDEWEFITEAQIHLAPWMFVRLNNALGITSKATDWAPEIGIVFSL